ncbi:hypothetical protein ACQ33O_09425 [Ferruginibacter sp. SUN002]|uniref:hypothetical protein n=1 Tax=Ferruginibacter sp. SUN002 TaxID=2937789 RepID=UPI003D367EDC
MDLLSKIDLVFKWLYDNSGKNPSLETIQKGLENEDIDIGEIKDILAKLKGDNFIYCVLQDNRMAAYSDYCNYLVTFDGKYFWETTKGYTEQARREQVNSDFLASQTQRTERNEERLVKWTKYLTFGTIAIVLWEIIKTFCIEGHSLSFCH